VGEAVKCKLWGGMGMPPYEKIGAGSASGARMHRTKNVTTKVGGKETWIPF
jgi:hypothetical protein